MGDSSSDSDAEQFSGIKQPTLLQQIKTILDEYRNDVQIIKELVQNADDAEATKMGILYDGNRAKESCLTELKYGKFLKTPALIFYNDAEFNDADWEGIKAIYSSVKKDDPLKIGRFGLGFKSVFHMTDNPCIISGENALFIDPHERRSDKVCATMKLRSWNKSKYRGYFDILKETFGFSEETLKTGKYGGTLFWFSLRQTPSKLSDDIYGEAEVLQLLQAFINESDRSLLFLKTLCCVEMFVSLPETEATFLPKRRKLDDNAYTEVSTTLERMNFGRHTVCYSVEVRNVKNDLRQKKRECLDQLKENGHRVPEVSKHWKFDTIVETERKCKNEEVKVARSRWLIVNYLKGGEIAERTKELMEDEDLRYLHLVGLAAPINEECIYKNDAGHIFCYQPLPQDSSSQTKLPVHLNAFFALSQNRRHVRWPDKDDLSNAQGDKKIEWNLALSSEMFPEAYKKLVTDLVELSKQGGNAEHLVKAVYNSIPNLENVDPQWKDAAERYILSCKDQDILFTREGDGSWINVHNAVLADFKRFSSIGTRCQQTVLDLLLKDSVHVVTVPDYVLKSLESKFADLTYVTPNFVRNHMKNCTSYKSLTRDQKQDLLQFAMLELSQHSLNGLELLPLADDSFISFSVQDHVLFENQDIICLFPGREKEFVSANVRPEIKELISTLADKGEYCVKRMTADAMVRLLQAALKTNKVQPIAEKEKRMPWVRSIWNLIQVRFKSSVDKFIGIPIFPVLDREFAEKPKFCLLPLQSNILFVPSLRQLEDKGHIFKSMLNLTVTVTDKIPKWLDYSLVHMYLPEDTNEGLDSLFSQINDKQIKKFNEDSSGTEAAALLKFLSERIHSDMTRSKMVLKKLKLFRGFIRQEEWERVALSECSQFYEGKQFPVKFPEILLRMESDTVVSFARRLGIKTVSETAVVINTLKNIDSYSITEKDTLMRWIINDETIFDQNMVQEYMKDTKFLKTSDGNVTRPLELFDPSDNQLIDLFKDQSVFPVVDYKNDHRYMAGLKKLGLKTINQLTSKDIEKVCSKVEEKFLERGKVDCSQCHALLIVMNEKSHLVTDSLLNKRCIKVNKLSGENYPDCIPLKNCTTPSAPILCSPSDIMSLEYKYLVGSVVYLQNCESLPHLSKQFDWQTQPSVDKVLEHLFNVVHGFDIKFKSTFLAMIEKIYRWLSEQTECGTDKLRELMKCKFASTKERYVWVGDGFQAPSHVYVEENETDVDDMRPLLHKLPSELSNLQAFFVAIGCRTFLEFDMYMDTLYRIKEECETRPVRIPHVKLRKLAVAILNKIHDDFIDELRESKKELFFPVIQEENEYLSMKVTNQCTFCDAQWLKDMDIEMDDDIFFVHPEVPSATAESLGVPSLRQQMLSNTEAFEEWGQEEPLTRRLRNLLDNGGYSDGSVAKELFQNADDAGASVLYILFDERENNDAKTQLISDGMAQCQGPALWVYNDAKFTEEDFKNITKLSGGTKEDDTTKIGKFGLGFCSVYNVTDVPSFVSGDNVVIFDPHTTFLGKALPGNSPGLRINFQVMKNRNMMKRLKNQFKPFDHIFDCKMTDGVAPSIDGTLFRLPLRNKASEIADTAYTPSRVKDLFRAVMSMAANMLLFSQNVSVVKLFHLQKSEKDPVESKILYEACKETKQMPDSDITGRVLAEASKRKYNKELSENPIFLVEKVTIKVAFHAVSTFDIRHSFNKDGHETVSDWLVSWATGSCKKMLQFTYEEKGAINLGAVAVPVKFSRQMAEETTYLEICTLADVPSGFYKTGHLFFFLPLPITHTFPFHVNGQFSVTTSRQQLQISTEDDTNQKTKDWNENLLSDPITRALLCLLQGLKSLGQLKHYSYYQLWPRNEINPTLKCLQRSFYQNVACPEIYKVFEKDGNWFDISRCVFIDLNFRQSCVGDLAFEVLSSLTEFVLEVPVDIYCSLLEAHRELVQAKTVTEEQFFIEHFFPNLDIFNGGQELVRKRNLLLRYAIKHSTKYSSIQNWLRSNKCIPSVPNGLLQCPMELIDPDSNLAALFCPSDGRFPDAEFTDKNIRDQLINIGLICEYLTDSLVDDRARSIKTLQENCSSCATERAGHLLAYMCENSSKHREVFANLQDISFIPIKCKPRGWQFQWYADNISDDSQQTNVCEKQHSLNGFSVEKFTNSSNIFHNSCKDIVGCVALVFEERVCKDSGRAITGTKMKDFLKEIGMKGLPKANVNIDVVLNQLDAVASQSFKVSASNEVVLRAIYNHLEDVCTNEFDPKNLTQQLKEKPIVYVSHTFTLPQYVAKSLDKDCKPYLFKLEDSPLRDCPNLCQHIGIVDNFDPTDMALLVQKVKQENGEKPLSRSEINAIINILTCFEKSIKTGTVKSFIGGDVEAIFGPDDQGTLHDCTTMCFNDFDDIEKSETMIYTHEDFTPHLARRLGVKPKAIQNLEDHSEDIEDFYQEEPLVTRLQRLVEGYPCDSGIFKELLQNADDAKATEIVFLKDYVSHPVNNIVDNAFQPLQGPALCVFNNSAFSNEDLKGIQRLGRGSKSDDPSQTGRYGVGFNAVYNLTDAPSFYTKGGEIENGETICFFDPLAKFIPNVSKKRPGKRYKNVKSIKRHHSDMVSGYHEKYFLSEQGTVFRFPLRTLEMARSSEIKQESVDMSTVATLLDSFCSELGEVVLFLKNLRKVRVLAHSARGYEEDFSITLSLTEEDKVKKDEITRNCGDLCREIKNNKNAVLTSPQKSSVYELCATEERAGVIRVRKYIIAETLGFKEEKNIPPLLRQKFLDGKIGLAPHGGVAVCAGGSTDTTPSNYYFENDVDCKAFCFLPLPIKTGLPVHVHGYFSLDHESRRTLWKSETAETCYRTLWNNSLIECVISPAYVKLLEHIKERMFEDITGYRTPFLKVSRLVSNYQTLFPLACNINDSYWKHLMCCVYKELTNEHISFLPCMETTQYSRNKEKMTTLFWTPFIVIGHKYPTYVMEESSIVDSESQFKSDFNNILRRIGMKIAFITEATQISMNNAELEISCVKPETLIDFLGTFKSANADKCKIETEKYIKESALNSVQDVERILEFCVKNAEYLLKNLKNIPLMITQDNMVHILPDTGLFYVIYERFGRFNHFFPTKVKVFLSGVVASFLCHHYKKTFHTISSIKKFGLNEFVGLVRETGILQERDQYLAWNKETPNVKWISLFWDFFEFLFPHEIPEGKVEFTKAQLQIVQSLPLIPAHELSNEQEFLVPPCDMKRLIDIGSFRLYPELQELFLMLNIPQIDNTVFSQSRRGRSEILAVLMELIPNCEHPNNIIECLHKSIQKLHDFGISNIHARDLLDYINVNYRCLNAFDKLRDLPLFETHFGELVALSKYTERIVLEKVIPNAGLEKITAGVPHVLLLKDTGLHQLFECLKIKTGAWIEVYERYIIPNQEHLQRDEFYRHIEFLSRHVSSDDPSHSGIVAMLRHTAFVETLDRKRVRVCELFDPSHLVFKTMCEKAELVPEQFEKNGVLKLFRLLGLQTQMTMHLFIRFARKIETVGNSKQSSSEVSRLSKVLIHHLFRMKESFYDQEIFDELARINFITPFVVDENLSAIHRQFNCSRLMCFEGSVLKLSEHIAWTVMSILPDEADPSMKTFADKMIDKLHIFKAPSVENLVEHCTKIGTSLGEKMDRTGTICDSTVKAVMSSVYQALDEHLKAGTLTTSCVRAFDMVPIIYSPEPKKMLTAKRVVNSCRDDEEIPPYLNKCPSDFAQYHNLFLFLGAKKEPTTEVFATVLNNIAIECGASAILLPKESADGKKAMQYLFQYLIQQNEELHLNEDKLFLVGKNETLEAAQTLIFINNKFYERQLTNISTKHVKLMFPIEKLLGSKLKVEDCIDSLKHLSHKCRPHLLTDVIRERVVLDNIVNKDGKIANELEHFIHSRFFVKGFLRLIRHVYRSSNTKSWNQDEERRLATLVENVNFKHATGIETTLSLACITDGEVGEEILIGNTNEAKCVHLEINRDTVCIYFDTSDQKWISQLTKQFTVYLNSQVGKCLKDETLMVLMEMIGMKDSMTSINDFLSKEKIEEYEVSIEINEGLAYPVPGTIVPKCLHNYLDNDYGVINEYEYKFIAFEVEDPAFTDSDDDTDEEDREVDPTYIFVHIIRKLEQTSELPLFQEYEINDGTENARIVKAYQLFKFVRKKVSNSNNDKEIVVYEKHFSGCEGGSSSQQDTLSFKEAKSEIRKYLRTACTKPEMERRRIVKRLLLKWHPDKNPNNVEFSTKVFQYIQQCLFRLEKGHDLKDDDDNDKDCGSSGNRSYSQSWSSSWHGRFWRRYKRGWRNNSSSNRSYNDFDDWWSFKRTRTTEEEEPYHWYSEARRWMKQAESDIENAEASMQNQANHSFNWICYKAHQGAEKALKAAWYAEDANKIRRVKYSHNLTSIASGLHSDIAEMASRLSREAGDHSRMRYPDMFSGQQIPAEAYTRENALNVIRIAREIISAVRSKHIK